MRRFKTAEELEQERLETLGLLPFKMPTDKLLLIYARQSTKGQTLKNRESAMQQTQDQLERAIELGWPFDKRLLFIENQAKDGTVRNASGRLRIDEREGLSTVMIYIQSDEASAVMARDVARFFRDEDLVGPVVFAKACKDHNVIVITDDYIYNFNDKKRGREDYKKFIQEAQTAADFLEKHVKGVMHKNRRRKGLRGEFAGHGVPIGYMLDENRTFYVPNPYHEKPVKNLFKRFRALGGNLADLRREIIGQPLFCDLPPEILKRIGKIYLTQVPGGWTIKSRPGLAYILTNPVYIGHISYMGQIVKRNAHTAIVDEDDFWYAYYRLSDVDFDGNPIEHPDGVTKRYQQAETIPYEVLFMGLRFDGTPVITTSMSEKASVYARRDGEELQYIVEDRSKIAVSTSCVRINAEKLARIFSERLHYRVGEALKSSSEYPLDDDANELEAKRREIHSLFLNTLEVTEESEDEQTDPLQTLRNTIAETEAKIAEKERISEHATDVMSIEDLRKHFASLSRLRLSLEEMNKKLNRSNTIEQEQKEAMGKLPEVYEKWSSMSMEAQRRFVRVATYQIILDELKDGWIKLTVEWSPVLGGSLVDEAYIWTSRGTHPQWTEEEECIVKNHYATASRQWLIEQLSNRSWIGIRRRGEIFGISRPHGTQKNCSIPYELSLADWKFIQDMDLSASELLEKRVFWKEYVGLSLMDNKESSR